MIKSQDLTQTALDELLRWLDCDREKAGCRYEQIRRALIKLFTVRGCHHAEELADETLSRVAHKASTLATTYEGDPMLYFYGVAKNVYHEYLRSISRESGSEAQQIQDQSQIVVWASLDSESETPNETRVNCLLMCLRTLPDGQRDLVTAYYDDEQGKKKESRKTLAQRRQVSVNALRLKAHRVRLSLRQCVRKCMENNLRHETGSRIICV